MGEAVRPGMRGEVDGEAVRREESKQGRAEDQDSEDPNGVDNHKTHSFNSQMFIVGEQQ